MDRRAFLRGLTTTGGTLLSGRIVAAERSVNVADYRQASDPPGDDSPALQRAVNAAARIRATTFLPQSSLTIRKQVVLPDGTILEGSGPGSVIIGDCPSYLTATKVGRIALRNFALRPARDNSAAPVDAFAVSQLTVENVSVTAVPDGGVRGITSFGLRIRGCENILIDRCRFINSNDAIYLEAYEGRNCGAATVRRSWFEHTTHGTFFPYPGQVYQYYCDHLVVDDCDFVNIFPGNLKEPAPVGYGVYEGDGLCLSTTVRNCRFRTTEPRADTVAILTSTSKTVQVSGNSAVAEHPEGGGFLFRDGGHAETLVVADNEAEGWDIFIAEAADVGIADVRNNRLSRGNPNSHAAIRFGANGYKARRAIARGNTIRSVRYGGIMFNGADMFEAEANVITDANKSNTAYEEGANEFKVSAISAYGPVRGRIAGNQIANTRSGRGRARFGIGISSLPEQHAITIEDDNTLEGMEARSILNGTMSSRRR